jgi:hypothetical protein
MHRFTREQLDYLREIAPGRSTAEHTRMMNERFKLQLTQRQVMSAKKNHHITSGLTGRFVKGQTAWNAGIHFESGGRSAETRFRKGNLPHNYMPVGTERVNTDGYLDVKIADPNKWRAKHRLIWEAAHGKVPKGHAIIFADQDRMNVTLENLILVSRAQLATMNKVGLLYNNADSTKSGLVIADVLMAASRRKKGTDEKKTVDHGRPDDSRQG